MPLEITTKWRGLLRNFPLSKLCCPLAARWICLALSCLVTFVSSSMWQTAWQNAMRATFQQTETDSNIFITFAIVGAKFGYLGGGFMYEGFGSQFCSIIGGLLYSGAHFIIAAAISDYRSFFAEHLWLLNTVYFLLAVGGTINYTLVMVSNVENFSHQKRGKVLGLLDASLNIGVTFYTFMYKFGFTKGNIQPGSEDKQDLSGYFLTIAILSLVISGLGFFLIGSTSKNERDLSETDQLIQRHDEIPSDFTEFPYEQIPFWKAVKHINFWLLLAQFVLSGCLLVTFGLNIPTYLRSFNLNEYNLLATASYNAVQIFAKLFAGIISDLIARHGKWPRSVVFIAPYLVQTIFLVFSIFYADNIGFFVATCLVLGTSTAVAWSQTPNLLGELFGVKYLGSNFGFSNMFIALFSFQFSLAYSWFYERAITEPGSKYCYGKDCFFWSFILLSICSFLALISSAFLVRSMSKNAERRRNDEISVQMDDLQGPTARTSLNDETNIKSD